MLSSPIVQAAPRADERGNVQVQIKREEEKSVSTLLIRSNTVEYLGSYWNSIGVEIGRAHV
jgi:hypothetical protein